ncbi:MAG: rhomboid family intramembrane serine protease [Bacteroidia bacterium]
MSNQFSPGRFDVLPLVVKNILILNGLFFLATYVLQTSYGIDLIAQLGLRFPGASKFRIWQPITHLFMHGSINHILFNMFSFWMFGSVLENVWGSKRFLNFYIITGLGAATLHYLIVFFIDLLPILNQIDLDMVTASGTKTVYLERYRAAILNRPNIIGASGAVAGIWMAFAYLFPNSTLYLFFALPVKAKYLMAAYIVIELYQALRFDPTDQVAHFAHLGGILFGFVIVKYLYANDRRNFY